MSLTRKSALIVIITLVCMLAVMYVTTQSIILQSFENLEHEKLQENVERTANLFKRQAEHLESTAGDWSCWDDTYEFILEENPDYIEANLTKETFANLDLDFLFLYDTNDRLVLESCFDPTNGKKVKADAWFKDLKQNADFLLDHQELNSKKSGIIETPFGLAILSSRTVLQSNEEGPVAGTLIMGRYLTKDRLKQISKNLRLNLIVFPSKAPSLPADFQVAKLTLQQPGNQPFFAKQFDIEAMSAYALLPGIENDTTAVFRIDQPHQIINQGRYTTHFFNSLLIIEGLIFSGIILLLIRTGVLSRLLRLQKQVERIGKSADFSKRVDVFGKDEIAELSIAVNSTLESLEKSEERYKLLADNVSDVIFIRSLPNLELQYISPSIKRLKGYSAEESMELAFSDVLPPESLRRFKKVIAEELEKDKDPQADPQRSRTFEVNILHKDGSSVCAELKISFLRDKNGNADAVLGIARDVSERKMVEEELLFHSFLLNQSKEFILSADLEGRIVYANEALANILGLRPEQLIGQTMDVFPQDIGDGPTQLEALQLAIQNGHWFGERLLQLPDGSLLPVELRIQMTYDEAGNPKAIFSVGRDVSFRKEAEKEKEKLEEQLLQSQKLEAVGRLAGGVAHDFNNILTGINGYAEMILDEISQDHPFYEDIAEIKKSGERAASLTEQLLAFSRKQIIAPKVVEVNQIIQQARKMLTRIIGEDIEMLFQPSEPLWQTKIDPVQVDQVLINLAANARDAMPNGGRLTIETSNISLDKESLKEKPEAQPGDYVVLSVSDTGSGMDEQTKEHIFEPFFSTKSKHKGAGLGLATIYGIVKQNSGLVSVYSEPGMGTSFKIYLPRVDVADDKIAKKNKEVSPSGTETVLLVEDESMVRGLARRILTQKGYQVIETVDVDDAIGQCKNPNAKIDLLLTDVIMPKMNGKELFIAIKPYRPEVKVLFMSGYPDTIIAHHGVLDENSPFISKPFSMQSLTGKVRQVLDGQASTAL